MRAHPEEPLDTMEKFVASLAPVALMAQIARQCPCTHCSPDGPGIDFIAVGEAAVDMAIGAMRKLREHGANAAETAMVQATLESMARQLKKPDGAA